MKQSVVAEKEKTIFRPFLKKWHPIAAGVAVITLYSSNGTLLKQYLGASPHLTEETVTLLQRASKLEKVLIQMVVDCEDGGKAVIHEMVLYEFKLIILNLLKQWIQDSLKKGKDPIQGAKETETWNPKSKTEPYEHPAIELMRHVKESTDGFLQTQVSIIEDLVHDLAEGFEHLFQDYITLIASCGCWLCCWKWTCPPSGLWFNNCCRQFHFWLDRSKGWQPRWWLWGASIMSRLVSLLHRQK